MRPGLQPLPSTIDQAWSGLRATWNTADIYEISALLAVYGMVFIALLALLRLGRRRSASSRART